VNEDAMVTPMTEIWNVRRTTQDTLQFGEGYDETVHVNKMKGSFF